MTRDLTKLKEYLDAQIITQDEFDKKKVEIIEPQGYKLRASWALNFLKYFAWPLVALIAISTFYGPIKTQLLASQEVKIGSIYLKVKESATLKGKPDLTKDLAGLSPEAFKIFLTLASSNYSLKFIGTSDDEFSYLTKKLEIYKEFEKRNLISVSEDLASFERFFLRLGPQESQVYIRPGEVPNSWRSRKSDEYSENSVLLTLKKADLSGDDIKRTSDIQLTISDQGKIAFDLIFDAVTSDIRSSVNAIDAEADRLAGTSATSE